MSVMYTTASCCEGRGVFTQGRAMALHLKRQDPPFAAGAHGDLSGGGGDRMVRATAMLCGVCVVQPHALNSTCARAAQLNSRLLHTCAEKECVWGGHRVVVGESYVSNCPAPARGRVVAWVACIACGNVSRMVSSTCGSGWDDSWCTVVGSGSAAVKAYLSTCVRLVFLSQSRSAAGCSCCI